jgi:KaiC/GvpD/RAD55 family RecA-like ATPase
VKCEYAEFVVGGLTNRGTVLKTSEFKLRGTPLDCFRSLFLFDEKLLAWVKDKGSVAGFEGVHCTDTLAFDFDGPELETVRLEVLKFLGYMETILEIPIDYSRVCFSGSKGFHITFPITILGAIEPSVNFAETYRRLITEITEGFQVDLSIYEIRRLFRLMNTKHSKTGLFKVPITFEELSRLTPDEIRELAKVPRKVEGLPASEMSVVESLRGIYLQVLEARSATPQSGPTGTKLTDLLAGVAEGNRNVAATSLAGSFFRKGLDVSEVIGLLDLWNTRNIPPMDSALLKKLAEGVHKRYFQGQGVKIVAETLGTAAQRYAEFVANLRSRLVKTGLPTVDRKIRGVAPGETLCILAKTSVGKSALAQNIAHSFVKSSGEPVLFFSMEMPLTSVFERAMQIETGVSGYDIERSFVDDPKRAMKSAGEVCAKIPSFFICAVSGLNLEGIAGVIEHAEQHIYGRKTGLVIIDYLSLVHERGSEIYEQVSRAARGTKELAKSLNVATIFLSQVHKGYSEYDELELNAARDSGAVDEASDFVVGLWKNLQHKETEGTDGVIHMFAGLVKNRRGGRGYVKVVMDKTSLRISEETPPTPAG